MLVMHARYLQNSYLKQNKRIMNCLKQNIVDLFINFNNIALFTSMQLPQPFLPSYLQPENIVRDSSTKSQNSSQSGTRKSLKQTIPLTKKQIDDFNIKIKEEIAINKKRYQKLLALNPYFSIKLYSPINTFTQDDYHSGTLKKMIKQIDMLLEEGNLIEKQIKKSQLKCMQSDYLDPNQRNQIKNHYTYLRKIWVDFSKVQQPKNSSERLEQLNKRVVMIKNNVFTVAQHQKRCYQHLQKYQNVDKKVAEMICKTNQYHLLQEKYQTLNMAMEQSYNKLKDICEQYQQKLSEKNDEIVRLGKDSEQQKRINKQLKQKMASNQKRLQQKINQLESEIKLKAKLHSNMKQNLQNQNNLKFLKEQNYIHQIKFRKIDFQSNRKNNFQAKESKETLSDKAIIDQSQTIIDKQQSSLKEVVDKKTTDLQNERQESPNQPEQDNDRNQLRENKSIDGRRGGRFARMRSPVNAKLIKPKYEEQASRNGQHFSPRTKNSPQDSKQLTGIRTCQ